MLFGSDSDTDSEPEDESPVDSRPSPRGQLRTGGEGLGFSKLSRTQAKPKLLPVHDADGNVIAFQQYFQQSSVTAPLSSAGSTRKEFKHVGRY